jgi:hypothetical protein
MDPLDRIIDSVSPTLNELQEALEYTRELMTGILEFAQSDSNLTTLNWRIMGSVERGTCLTPIEDVDVMLYIPGSMDDAERTWSLLRIGVLLQGMNTGIVIDEQDGTMVYKADGHPQIEIVPAFDRIGGGYLIPGPRGIWIPTDPPRKAQHTEALDISLKGRFKPFVRLLKTWRKTWNFPLNSWHVEAMAGSLSWRATESYESWTVTFFEQASSVIDIADPDAVGGPFLVQETRHLIREAEVVLSASLAVAHAAFAAQRAGDPVQALTRWHAVFGIKGSAEG